MIRSKLKWLRLAKEEKDGAKLSYRRIAEEASLSVGTVQRMMANDFDRIDVPTIDALCSYFGCGVGDLLEFVPGAPH